METGETLMDMFYERIACTDRSGSYELETHNVVTPPRSTSKARTTSFPWEITDGTGAYESLTGQGEYKGDPAAGEGRWTGEVQGR